jgi:hypothetical protein
MYRFFKDDDFNFVTLSVLGSTAAGSADVGEVLAAVESIKSGDATSWVNGWVAAAEALLTEAEGNAAAGRRRSAAAQQLRASNYLAAATYHADGTSVADQFATLWERHRAAWDAAVDLGGFAPHTVERIEVPYGDTTLPGYFFRSGPATEPRRTLVYVNGSDGSVTNSWSEGIGPALARGWNAVTVDGPGQNAALVRQGIPFRPDWEAVLTPVLDSVLARPDVDADKVTLLGVSQAGYWVLRALCFEHRVAAAVVDPGVLDVSTTLHEHLGKSMLKLIDEGQQAKFDQEIGLYERFSRSTRAMLMLRMRPYGASSPYEFFAAARKYRLDPDQLTAVTCPVLVTDPEGEQFWPGQPRELFEKLPGEKALVPFTRAEGANFHCEPMGAGIRAERLFDWLDDVVPA